MKIESLIVADGRIDRAEWKFGNAVLQFVCFDDRTVTISFKKVVSVSIKGPCIGFSLCELKIAMNDNENTFSFLDEDGNSFVIRTQTGRTEDVCALL